nr:protein SIEVE ELEMENT OCCLUSION B-like [Ipomoea batatas]
MSQNNTRPGYPLTNDAITGAPRTTINPVHQIIPKPNNLNPRSLATTTPTAYPAKQEVLPVTTAAAAYPAAPLSTALVSATVQPVNPLQAAAKTAVPAVRGGRLLKRGDLHSGTEDAIMMDHVRATHDLDASHYNVKPLVHVIEDIIPRAKAAVPGHAQGDQSQPRLDAILEDKILHSGLTEALETFAYPVHRTSLERALNQSSQEISKIKHQIKRKVLEETLARTHTDNKYSAELITCGENDPMPIIHGADMKKVNYII